MQQFWRETQRCSYDRKDQRKRTEENGKLLMWKWIDKMWNFFIYYFHTWYCYLSDLTAFE